MKHAFTLLILTLAACAPKAPPKANPAPAAPPVAAKPNRLVFSADHKCTDKLAKNFVIQEKLRNDGRAELTYNLRALNEQRAAGLYTKNHEDHVKAQWVALRNATLAFDMTYGEFGACERRADGKILESKTLTKGMAALKTQVEALGPLPPVELVPLVEAK